MDDKSEAIGDKEELIEIERRFLVDHQCEERLLENGAKLLSRLSFYDVYYDNRSYDLIVNNYWLRCRDGQWQLKCPPEDGQGTDRHHTLQYAEHLQISDILDRLRYVLMKSRQLGGGTSGDNTGQVKASDRRQESHDQSGNAHHEMETEKAEDDELKIFLETNNLKPFASFRTQRTKYRVGEDITVDLDTADFGYSVGEIEVMLRAGQPRDEAVEKINDFAHKLGVYSDQNVPGKLFVYLKRYQSGLYRLLKKTFKL